jgi:protoheme IX farnesyltransferase
MGPLYGIAAVLLGAIFFAYALHLRKVGRSGAPTMKPAMRLFGWSITYLTLLFFAMALDAVL